MIKKNSLVKSIHDSYDDMSYMSKILMEAPKKSVISRLVSNFSKSLQFWKNSKFETLQNF